MDIKVTRNGLDVLDKRLYYWDKDYRVFITNEDNLEIDFGRWAEVKIIAKNNSIIKTGNNCLISAGKNNTIITGDYCVFDVYENCKISCGDGCTADVSHDCFVECQNESVVIRRDDHFEAIELNEGGKVKTNPEAMPGFKNVNGCVIINEIRYDASDEQLEEIKQILGD